MTRTHLANSAYRRPTLACGAAVALVGAAALTGWAVGHPLLLGLRASYIPMAPNTALAFIVLGFGLFAIGLGGRGSGLFAGAGGVLVALIGALRLGEFAGGAGFEVDEWFFRVRGGRFGLAPIGKMSLPTAAAFVASGGATAVLSRPSRPKWLDHAAGACGAVAAMTGLVFALGYLFSPNSPLLYGTESIPMALNTALSFIVLGAGIASAAGPEAFPLLRLSGPSIRARLLRIFLPLVVGTVGVVSWMTHLITTTSGASSAAISSAALAAASILLFGMICERIAGRVGGQIERAEADLRQAHDLLEIKVEERTRELNRTNGELAEALREARNAHQSLQGAHLELQLAQSRMLQQARMASLGQTAAGVAHEINNPLAFVTNNLVVLRREVGGLHDILKLYQQAAQTLEEYQADLYARITGMEAEVDLPFVLENLDGLLERSRVGLMRIQKIVADLRDFAHLDEAEFKEVDLNAGIGTAVRLMRKLADDRRVSIETTLAPLPPTTCFPAKINLVVQSLISNAIDACRPGGRVLVATREVGGGSEIRVSDDGRGIPAKDRDRIFDPFFTTKPVGEGTGLGLTISYGVVKEHGGTIEFTSTPGRGTTFTVLLPTAPPADALASPAPIVTDEREPAAPA
ncbi:sensor histidine kinase [Paludisphaera soli]|uniref:sensor histidine kinase n=1 Tax=Paludisphaera soli TaxID=2712865 RepID=UPI0013EB2B1E|nr:ATP-binding protein [Paludisphaera soli]